MKNRKNIVRILSIATCIASSHSTYSMLTKNPVTKLKKNGNISYRQNLDPQTLLEITRTSDKKFVAHVILSDGHSCFLSNGAAHFKSMKALYLSQKKK